MTNTSFSKISDLILPGKGRSNGQSPDRAPNPGAARQFERLLETVKERSSGEVQPQDKPLTQTDQRRRPDVRPADRRPVADRPSLERRDNDRPQRFERDEVDRSDTTPINDEAEEIGRRDDVEAGNDLSEDDNETKASSADQDGGENSGDAAASEDEPGQQENDAEAGVDSPNGDAVIDLAAVTEGQTNAEVADEPRAAAVEVVAVDIEETSKEQTVESEETATDEVDASVAAAAVAAVTGQSKLAEPVTTDEITIEQEAEGTVAAAAADGEAAAESVADTEVALVDAEVAVSDENEEVAVSADEIGNETDQETAEGDPQSQPGGEQTAEDGEQAPQQSVIAGSPTGVSSNGAATAVAAGSASLAVGETTARTSAATTTAQTADAAPVADGEDGDILWRQVRRAIGSMRTTAAGDQQMTIRLRPAELGSVMIRVTTGEAGTTVALVAESAAAANQLNQQRQQLLSELEDGGLTEVAVDVGTEEDQRNQTEESEGDGEQPDGSDRATSLLASQDGEPLDRFQIRRNGGGASAGLVDLDL